MIGYSIQNGFSASYGGVEFSFERMSAPGPQERTVSLINRAENRPVEFLEHEICQKIDHGEMKVLTSGLMTKPGQVENVHVQKSPYQLHYEAQVYAYCKGLEQRGISKGMRKQIEAAIRQIAQEIVDDKPPSTSTAMRWMREAGGNPANYKNVTQSFLLQKRASKKPLAILEIAKEILDDYYFIPKTGIQKPDDIETCTARINLEFERRGIDESMSMSAVKRMIYRVPAYERDRIRLGTAEAKYKHRHSSGGRWPTRAFETVELDHTVLDLNVVDRLTGKQMARPTITVLKDRYTGYILSMWIGYEGESIGRIVRAISGALEDKRHLKDEYGLSHEWLTTPIIWEKLVLDNALSHHSEILHSMAKNLGFSIEFSAVRSPWEKGSVENLMLQFTRALPHHGRPTKPAEVKSKQSKKLEKARVYFDDLVQYLHQFVVDIYPHKLNKRTNTSPYIEMEKALREHGSLPKIHFTPLSDELRILTSRSFDRACKHGGIELNGLTYRSRELSELVHSIGPKQKLRICQDVNDIGEVFVLHPKTNQWISVPEKNYSQAKGKPLYKHKLERKKINQDLLTNGIKQKDWNARIEQSDAVTQLVANGVRPEKISGKEARASNIHGGNPNGDRGLIDVEVKEITQNTIGRDFMPETVGTSNNKLIEE